MTQSYGCWEMSWQRRLRAAKQNSCEEFLVWGRTGLLSLKLCGQGRGYGESLWAGKRLPKRLRAVERIVPGEFLVLERTREPCVQLSLWLGSGFREEAWSYSCETADNPPKKTRGQCYHSPSRFIKSLGGLGPWNSTAKEANNSVISFTLLFYFWLRIAICDAQCNFSVAVLNLGHTRPV